MRYVWTGLDKHILRYVHRYSPVTETTAHYTGDSLSPSQRQEPRTTELKLGLSSWRRGSCLSWQCSCVPEWAWRRLNLVPGLATLYTPASAVSTQLSCPLGSTACYAIMSMVILCTESLIALMHKSIKHRLKVLLGAFNQAKALVGRPFL